VPSASLIAVFAVATFVLTATPGPGVLYVVGRAVGDGRRSGFASMLGIETGEAVYIAATALGITALLAASPVALSVLRYGGAGYLLVLGVRAWRERAAERPEDAGLASRRHWGSYGRGLVVQLLNPKVAVFFLAYFPQFIRPANPVVPQVLLLGAIYLAICVGVDSCYVLAASWLADRLAGSERAQRRRARISALTYFALAAAALAFGDRGTATRAMASAAVTR
jgi:threonine/homoserine/homoserine lactone efflux protein